MTDTQKKEEANNIEDKKEKELELYYDKHLTIILGSRCPKFDKSYRKA